MSFMKTLCKSFDHVFTVLTHFAQKEENLYQKFNNLTYFTISQKQKYFLTLSLKNILIMLYSRYGTI